MSAFSQTLSSLVEDCRRVIVTRPSCMLEALLSGVFMKARVGVMAVDPCLYPWDVTSENSSAGASDG